MIHEEQCSVHVMVLDYWLLQALLMNIHHCCCQWLSAAILTVLREVRGLFIFVIYSKHVYYSALTFVTCK